MANQATWPFPFPELKDNMLIMKAIIEGQRPLCHSIEGGAPTQFIDVLKRCWHADPAKRPLILELETIFELFDIHGLQFPFQPPNEFDHQEFRSNKNL